ncbi:hypothetical protein ACFFUB_01065 [Algimonas porphyrae]|uniref:DUF2157 domain-containing protein n=1 Tax=Algimonas porphyrae TaxID=1128113 RepID=A0ABQ5UZA7_9PROT|nr:hypothetical protein [Algimonas porphyrae]GLQ20625.1 hypothetical protein GCM10007854_15800 [Algimonas porphyrae]
MTQLTRDQIDKAEAAGIIPASQARAMRTELDALEPQSRSAAVIGDEDELRFLRSFGDIFVGIGLVLLAIGVATITGLLGGGPFFLLAAAGAWIMAEWFGRRKRAHFPTLITALSFLAFIQTGLDSVTSLNGIVAALITVAAMALFYWRIRLPFCIALIAVALLYLLFATLTQISPTLLRNHFGIVMIGSGLLVFAVALLYDRQDMHRRTRFADNAFWLHLLAAPLIIHGLVGSAVASKTDFLFDVVPTLLFRESDAVIVLTALGIITVIGLAINRRALIVSSLFYAGAAIAFLVRQAGLDLGQTLSLTLILLGGAIVLLGVAWHPVRNQLVRILPDWRIFPPPYAPDAPDAT